MKLRRDDLVRLVQRALFVLAALLTVAGLVTLASRQKGHQELATLVARYADAGPAAAGRDNPNPGAKNSHSGPNPGGPAKNDPAQDPQVDRTVKRHVFSRDPPKQSFKLTGLLGDEAYFAGQAKGYRVGQSYRGAKIVEIGPDWVKLDFEGKLRTYWIFGSGGGGPPSRPAMPGRPGLTPKMMEKFKKMPPDARRKAAERMPAELRKELEKAP